MTDAIQLRSGTPADVAACGRICFDGFKTFNDQHGFPPDFPSVEAASGLMTMLFTHPGVFGVVAEANGRVVGSNFLWQAEPVMGVGPITVEPTDQGRSVGKRLMQRVLERARERNAASVRLCQAAFNTRSMSLYTKLGFDVREPLACMQGEPLRDPGAVPGHRVREATRDDVEACCDLARRVPDPNDRRCHALHLTAEGERVLAEASVRVATVEARLDAKLGPEGREELLAMLWRLARD